MHRTGRNWNRHASTSACEGSSLSRPPRLCSHNVKRRCAQGLQRAPLQIHRRHGASSASISVPAFIFGVIRIPLSFHSVLPHLSLSMKISNSFCAARCHPSRFFSDRAHRFASRVPYCRAHGKPCFALFVFCVFVKIRLSADKSLAAIAFEEGDRKCIRCGARR
jgi:hypothetical protein